MLPVMVAYFPKCLFSFLPANRPDMVKMALTSIKIEESRIWLSDIALRLIPTEKLSILTVKANIRVEIKPVNGFTALSSESLIAEMSIWIDRAKNIIPAIVLDSMGIIFKRGSPIKSPSSGINKWNIPTIVLIFIIVFILKFNVPRSRATERASILKPIANRMIEIQWGIISPI